MPDPEAFVGLGGADSFGLNCCPAPPDFLRTTPANSFMNRGSLLLEDDRFSLLLKKLGDPVSDVFLKDTFNPPAEAEAVAAAAAAAADELATGDEVAEADEELFNVAAGEELAVDGKIGGLEAEDPGLTTTLPGLELPPLDLGDMLTIRSEDRRLEFRLGCWDDEDDGSESTVVDDVTLFCWTAATFGRPGQCSSGSEIRLGEDDSAGLSRCWLW